MNIRKSYWNYIPIIICIFSGYIIGGYLSFGVKFLNVMPFITDEKGRLALILFGMGMLGSTTYCIRFWGLDVEEAVYDREELLPHLYDFFGYLGALIGGGISGIILYLIVKTGIIVSVGTADIHEIKFSVSIIIAYCGGLFHFRVQNILASFISKLLRSKEDDVKRGEKPFAEECKPRDPISKVKKENEAGAADDEFGAPANKGNSADAKSNAAD